MFSSLFGAGLEKSPVFVFAPILLEFDSFQAYNRGRKELEMSGILVFLVYGLALVLALLVLYRLRARAWYWHALSIVLALAIGFMPPVTALAGQLYDLLVGSLFTFLVCWGLGGVFFPKKAFREKRAWSLLPVFFTGPGRGQSGIRRASFLPRKRTEKNLPVRFTGLLSFSAGRQLESGMVGTDDADCLRIALGAHKYRSVGDPKQFHRRKFTQTAVALTERNVGYTFIAHVDFFEKKVAREVEKSVTRLR
jgi:hypothetical protein